MLNTIGEFYVILAAIVIIAIIKFLNVPETPPILNIYRTPSNFYWIKVGVLYVILYVKKLSQAIFPSTVIIEEVDKPQKLPIHEHAIDGVYFNGSGTQGDRFSMALNRRSGADTEMYVFVKIASLEFVLVHEDNPDTNCTRQNTRNNFAVKNLNVFSIIPTRKWKITYNGKMKDAFNATTHSVHLNLDFISRFPIFNYGTDFSCFLYAKAVALELWSVEFFNILKQFRAMQYGQFGKITGSISVDGVDYDINLNAYRDRIIANNFNWATYHRFIIHYINTEVGDRFVIAKVSQPITTSKSVSNSDCLPLTVEFSFSQGFMYCANDKKNYPLQNCNLELYQHGEVEDPPTDYAFSFEAGGREYTVQVIVENSLSCYLGHNWDCKLLERHCTVNVNGKKGWGSCQWLYKNVYGKRVCS